MPTNHRHPFSDDAAAGWNCGDKSCPLASDTHDVIALRAFQLWTQDGDPMGSDERHWQQAVLELGNGAVAKPQHPLATAQDAHRHPQAPN